MFSKAPFERREHSRSSISLAGRYMLADRREYPCTVVDVSPGGLSLKGPEPGKIGETVIVYVDELGRVQGQIVRHMNGGFALRFTGPAHAAEAFARRLGEYQGR